MDEELLPFKIWVAYSNCKKVDADKFYRGNERELKKSKRFCTGCRAQFQCRTYAIAHEEPGVWGGTTKIERNKISGAVVEAIRLRYYKANLLEYRPGTVSQFLERMEGQSQARNGPNDDQALD